MEADFSAANLDKLQLKVGEVKKIESLKKAVTPPFLLVIPFIDLPDCLALAQQDNMEGEGVQGCIFTVRAIKPGTGGIVTGFRDLRESKVIEQKRILVNVV